MNSAGKLELVVEANVEVIVVIVDVKVEETKLDD